MIFQFFIRFRAIALMIMPVGLNCGFEFEKGRQLLICFHNKASSICSQYDVGERRNDLIGTQRDNVVFCFSLVTEFV
jgi:hypothetical protein